MTAMIGAPDGRAVRGHDAGLTTDATQLGVSLAERLLSTGGRELVAECERGTVV
jgi:hypothetical protein